MASKSSSFNFDIVSTFDKAQSQFRGLNANEPGQWPPLPKVLAWLGTALLVIVGGWFLLLSAASDELDAERNKEPELKQNYRTKLAQAVNLGELRKQKLQVQEYVTQLEKQLPGKAEMDALLSDINQAGLGRGLLFDLFKPGQVEIKDYYAELPIALRVTGRFHDLGSFVADVANLSRIVTLTNVTIATPAKDNPVANALALPPGTLALDATARTYRYLSPQELADNAKAKAMAAKAGAKK
jgi:type IV pilus assembly protein PilO